MQPPDWTALPGLLARCGLLVNTTSLGMTGQPPLAIDLGPLPRHATVTDLVYAPLKTSLLAAAEALQMGDPASWPREKVERLSPDKSKKIFCTTFDELLSQFLVRLAALAAIETAVPGAAVAKEGKPAASGAAAASKKRRKGKR